MNKIRRHHTIFCESSALLLNNFCNNFSLPYDGLPEISSRDFWFQSSKFQSFSNKIFLGPTEDRKNPSIKKVVWQWRFENNLFLGTICTKTRPKEFCLVVLPLLGRICRGLTSILNTNHPIMHTFSFAKWQSYPNKIIMSICMMQNHKIYSRETPWN